MSEKKNPNRPTSSGSRVVTLAGDLLRALTGGPVTENYPAERQPAPERLRGMLHYSPEGCTGCALCVKDCPADALELITIDKVNKIYGLRYHADRCTFCGQCVQNCRFSCIALSNSEWELASADRGSFTVTYGVESEADETPPMESAASGQPEDRR